MRILLAIFAGLVQLASGQSCDEGWAEYAGSCYRVNDVDEGELHWHAARDRCVADGGELASVHSDGERDFLLDIASAAGQSSSLWLGLSQLADREGDYAWSDGTTNDYASYAPDEPNRDGYNQCVYSRGSNSQICFSRDVGLSTTAGLFDIPSDARPPDTHYFGYKPAPDDVDWCEEECRKEKNCYSFTFISTTHPDYVWQGECMGVNQEFQVGVADKYATSGEREVCGEQAGTWHSDNCGTVKGYACKKSSGAAPGTVPPTSTVPGFCPQGWFGLENKCYKLVEVDMDFAGLTWGDARDACRAEDGHLPDLASFHSRQEQALVTSQLQMYTLGLWIGYARDGDYGDWLWSDNSRPDDWTYWMEGEPSWGNEHCVELLISNQPVGMWNNFPCYEKRGYVCQSWKDASDPIMSPAPTTPSSCPEGYIPHWYGCYKYVETPSSWAAAEQACSGDQAHLASVHAEAENAGLMVLTGGETSAWLGFRKGGDDDFRWTDGWPTRYQRWGGGQPEEQHACTIITPRGTWNSSDCVTLHPYICKYTEVPRPTTPDIGDGACPNSNWKIYGSNCYYFGTSYSQPNYEQFSWEESLETCIRYGAGHSHPTSLASIHSWPENEFIYNTLDEIRGDDTWYLTRAWIGLSKKEFGAPYVWTDGTPFDFTAWMPGEPNDQDGTENCVELYVESAPGLWNDHFCTTVSAFVCKTELGEAPTTPTLPPDVPGDCPDGGDWEAYGAQCYLFKPDEYDSWDAAHGECKRFGGSIANLASVHSGSENYWIQGQLVEKSNMPVRREAWIGLKKTSSDTEWSWIEPGQDVSYVNWGVGAGEPGGPNNCVEMSSTDGLWNDQACTELRGYVCRAAKTSQDFMDNADDEVPVDESVPEKEAPEEDEAPDEETPEEETPAEEEAPEEAPEEEAPAEEAPTDGDDYEPVPETYRHGPVARMPQIQAVNVDVDPEEDTVSAGSVAVGVVGSVLVVLGILAAIILVKKTTRKPSRKAVVPDADVATSAC